MKINHHPEQVESYHYDMRVSEENVETAVNVSVTPIDMSNEKDFPMETSSVLGLRIVFKIAYDEFVISGAVRQPAVIEDRVINEVEHLTQDELTELMGPLFSLIKRMTYEVTEIALNQPGVTLDFGGKMEEQKKDNQ